MRASTRDVLLNPSRLWGSVSLRLKADGTLYQESAASTPAVAENDPIGWVEDVSGRGMHCTQSTGANRPTLHFDEYGLPCIRAGGASSLNIPAGHVVGRQSYSIFFNTPYRRDSGLRFDSKIGASAQSLYQIFENRWAYFNGGAALKVNMGPIVGPALHGLTCGRLFTCYQENDIVGQNANGSQTSLVGGQLLNFDGAFFTQADVYEIIIFNRELRADEVRALVSYARRTYGYHAQYTKQVVCEGDSMTAGFGSGAINTPYPNVLKGSLGLAWLVRNLATASVTVAQMSSNASARVDPIRDARYTKNGCVLWGGTNDLYFGATAAATYNNIVAYCQARQAVGWKVVVCTILPRSNGGTPGTFEADRQTVNTNIRANWNTFADALADVAANTTIGEAGDEANTTYYADLVHMTAAGYAIVEGIIRTAVLSL